MLSVPWVRQHTVTDAFVSPVDGSEVPATDTTAAGFGDPLLRVDYRIVDKPAKALQVGPPVRSSSRPSRPRRGGHGRTRRRCRRLRLQGTGRTSLLVDALYWKYGDPDAIDFQDTLSYSLAVARMLGGAGRWSTMLSLSGFSAGYDGMSPPVHSTWRC